MAWCKNVSETCPGAAARKNRAHRRDPLLKAILLDPHSNISVSPKTKSMIIRDGKSRAKILRISCMIRTVDERPTPHIRY